MFVPKEDNLLGVDDEDEANDKVKYVGIWSALEDDDEVDMRSTFIGLV